MIVLKTCFAQRNDMSPYIHVQTCELHLKNLSRSIYWIHLMLIILWICFTLLSFFFSVWRTKIWKWSTLRLLRQFQEIWTGLNQEIDDHVRFIQVSYHLSRASGNS